MLRLRFAQNRALLIDVALLLCLSMVCLAQESRGSITGKVVDPQNSVVPGATSRSPISRPTSPVAPPPIKQDI